ncbi:hypothetical protein [Mobilicoccus pelagius]|nr:hypothetical protein [Mobilicoccus pelagius]
MSYRPIALAAALASLVAPAAALPAEAAAPTCTGRVVARTDVDGDARRDTVSVTQVGFDEFQPRFRLCARTATGKVSNALDTADFPLAGFAPYYGAAGLDGVRGNEIVLRAGFGAHSQHFHVYTWRNGRLVRQNAPDTRRPDWYTDWAASVIKGYRFHTSRGVRYVVATYGMKDPSAPTFRVRQTTFRWSKGGWVRGTTRTVTIRDNSKTADAVYGWHGVSLPQD